MLACGRSGSPTRTAMWLESDRKRSRRSGRARQYLAIRKQIGAAHTRKRQPALMGRIAQDLAEVIDEAFRLGCQKRRGQGQMHRRFVVGATGACERIESLLELG